MEDELKQRPDPTFKRLTERAVVEAGINSKPNELKIQQVSSPDLLLEIPPNAKLEGTLFDFFRRYSIMEFKSRNDELNIPKFENQLARVHWWSSKHPEVGPENILNVIVSARYPREMINVVAEWGAEFKLIKQGIYQGRCTLQDVAIVVCEQLPIIPKYAIWLLFADPTTETWRETLRMLAQEGLLNLLLEASQMAPKEYKNMSLEIEEILAEYTSEEREQYLNDLQALTKDNLTRFKLEQLSDVLSALSPEQRFVGVTPEERLKGLAPEELGEALSKLPPEEKMQLLKKLQQS